MRMSYVVSYWLKSRNTMSVVKIVSDETVYGPKPRCAMTFADLSVSQPKMI